MRHTCIPPTLQHPCALHAWVARHTLLPASQGRALAELRELECTAASLAGAIQAGTLAKRQLLDELLEAERQLALAERKIQLEKEMQVWALGAARAWPVRRQRACDWLPT